MNVYNMKKLKEFLKEISPRGLELMLIMWLAMLNYKQTANLSYSLVGSILFYILCSLYGYFLRIIKNKINNVYGNVYWGVCIVLIGIIFLEGIIYVILSCLKIS